jgi:signal transduction histidine kinase
MRLNSLQARMIMVIAATIALCWAVALAVLFVYLTHNRNSIWDDKLQTIATRILLTIPGEDKLKGLRPRPNGLQLREEALPESEALAFQIWLDGSRLLVRSPGAPDTPLRPGFATGAATSVIAGARWRVYSASDKTGRVHVQVGNLHSVVDAELRGDAMTALVTNTLLLLLVGALMWFVVRRSLKPVLALGEQMRQRRSFDLTPLSPAPLPRELHPLVASFNHALRQLDEAVEGERRFIGDAAHELRTPLSALQAQAQIALRAPTAAEKDIALAKLLAVAERSTRLSEQLLDLARLNAGANAPQHAPADLGALVMHVANEFDVHALQHARTILLDARPCTIRCDIDEIGILLRNLVDNALRYTPRGGRVRVSCGHTAGSEPDEARRVYLEVADDGPGVPAAERAAIFKRFHRVAGTPSRGSGIGLSLVAGIAEVHRATIETGAGLDGRGLGIRVLFPALVSAEAPALQNL